MGKSALCRATTQVLMITLLLVPPGSGAVLEGDAAGAAGAAGRRAVGAADSRRGGRLRRQFPGTRRVRAARSRRQRRAGALLFNPLRSTFRVQIFNVQSQLTIFWRLVLLSRCQFQAAIPARHSC